MDKVILAGVQFRGHHGDSPEEQAVGGRFEVDLEMLRDTHRAERSDTLGDTVDYFAVHRRIMHIGQSERHRLLESLAGNIARMALTEFDTTRVTVTVRKLLPPLDGIVAWSGVSITRNREDY